MPVELLIAVASTCAQAVPPCPAWNQSCFISQMSVACILEEQTWLRCSGGLLQLLIHGKLHSSRSLSQIPRASGEGLNLPNEIILSGVCERDGIVLLSDAGNYCGLALISPLSKSAGFAEWFDALQLHHVLFDEFSGNYAETTDGAFQLPAGCCIGPGNLWYIVDEEGARVNVYDPDGGDFIAALGSGFGDGEGELDHPKDVVQVSATAVAVLDAGNCRVQVFQVYPPGEAIEDPLDAQEDAVSHVTDLDTESATCIAAVREGGFVVADGPQKCLLQGGGQWEGTLLSHATDDTGQHFDGPIYGLDVLQERVAVLHASGVQFTSAPFKSPPSDNNTPTDRSTSEDGGLSEASSLPGGESAHRTPGAAGQGGGSDSGEDGGVDPFADSSDSGGSSPPPLTGAGQESTGVLDTLSAAKLLAAQRVPSGDDSTTNTEGASNSTFAAQQQPVHGEGGAGGLSHAASGGTLESSLPDDLDDHAARIQAVFRGHQSRTRARMGRGSPRGGAAGGPSDGDSSSLDPFASDDDSSDGGGGGVLLAADTVPAARPHSRSGSDTSDAATRSDDTSARAIQAAFRASRSPFRPQAARAPVSMEPDADVTLANQPWLRNSGSVQSLSTDGGQVPVEGGGVGGVGPSRGSAASPLHTPRLAHAGSSQNKEHKEADAEDGVVAVQSAWRARQEREALREAVTSPARELNATLNRSRQHDRDVGASALRGIPTPLAQALGPKALRWLHDMPPGQAAMVAASVARSTAKARVASAQRASRRQGRRTGETGSGRGSPSMDIADEVLRLQAGAGALRAQLDKVNRTNAGMARELAALAGVPIKGEDVTHVFRPEPPMALGYEGEGGIMDAPSYSGVRDATWLEMRCVQLSSRIAVLEQERGSGTWRPSGPALKELARAAEHTVRALHRFAPGLTAAVEGGNVPSEMQLLRQIRATRMSVASLGETNEQLQLLLEGASAPPAPPLVQRSKQQLAADMQAAQAAMDDTREQLAAVTAAAGREQAAVAALVQRRAVLRAMLAETGLAAV